MMTSLWIISWYVLCRGVQDDAHHASYAYTISLSSPFTHSVYVVCGDLCREVGQLVGCQDILRLGDLQRSEVVPTSGACTYLLSSHMVHVYAQTSYTLCIRVYSQDSITPHDHIHPEISPDVRCSHGVDMVSSSDLRCWHHLLLHHTHTLYPFIHPVHIVYEVQWWYVVCGRSPHGVMS